MNLTTLVAAMLAALAIALQATPPPRAFTRGMERRGEPVIEATFQGMEWECGDETCFAGFRNGVAITGP